MSELDPAGVLPDRVYGKDELLASYGWIHMTRVESLLYNMRHVKNHAAQLNLLLRQFTNSTPPGWVPRTDL